MDDMATASVTYVIDSTTRTTTIQGPKISAQIFTDGRGHVEVRGPDDKSMRFVMFRNVEMIDVDRST
jgi:hypothetical protein